MMLRARFALLCALALFVACDRSKSASPATASQKQAAPATMEIEAQPQDSVIVEERLAWAREQRLDTLGIGEIVARIGRTFVGAPYRPGTLDVDGTERLVINLREFDCVTFVENSLALARVVAGQGGFAAFKRELLLIRYRNGKISGYPSRLHYFSEWIADNEAKGIVRNITRELGGAPVPEPIHFMTSHASSYRQLADTAQLAEIRRIEQRLSITPRYYIPEDRIAAIASGIHNGDVIAATSTLPGLDIAHTGIALWIDDRLHLMHAPLVGKSVEISEKPLAGRIKSIPTQDGIMVARPL